MGKSGDVKRRAHGAEQGADAGRRHHRQHHGGDPVASIEAEGAERHVVDLGPADVAHGRLGQGESTGDSSDGSEGDQAVDEHPAGLGDARQLVGTGADEEQLGPCCRPE